jgi:hypothetical protein
MSDDILYVCRCGQQVTVPHKIDMHCCKCSSVMLPSDEYKKIFPPEKIDMHDHSWEEVAAKATEIAEGLLRQGYSGMDIITIAGQILHHGTFAAVHSAIEWISKDPDRKVRVDVKTVGGDIVRVEMTKESK